MVSSKSEHQPNPTAPSLMEQYVWGTTKKKERVERKTTPQRKKAQPEPWAEPHFETEPEPSMLQSWLTAVQPQGDLKQKFKGEPMKSGEKIEQDSNKTVRFQQKPTEAPSSSLVTTKSGVSNLLRSEKKKIINALDSVFESMGLLDPCPELDDASQSSLERASEMYKEEKRQKKALIKAEKEKKKQEQASKAIATPVAPVDGDEPPAKKSPASAPTDQKEDDYKRMVSYLQRELDDAKKEVQRMNDGRSTSSSKRSFRSILGRMLQQNAKAKKADESCSTISSSGGGDAGVDAGHDRIEKKTKHKKLRLPSLKRSSTKLPSTIILVESNEDEFEDNEDEQVSRPSSSISREQSAPENPNMAPLAPLLPNIEPLFDELVKIFDGLATATNTASDVVAKSNDSDSQYYDDDDSLSHSQYGVEYSFEQVLEDQQGQRENDDDDASAEEKRQRGMERAAELLTTMQEAWDSGSEFDFDSLQSPSPLSYTQMTHPDGTCPTDDFAEFSNFADFGDDSEAERCRKRSLKTIVAVETRINEAPTSISTVYDADDDSFIPFANFANLREEEDQFKLEFNSEEQLSSMTRIDDDSFPMDEMAMDPISFAQFDDRKRFDATKKISARCRRPLEPEGYRQSDRIVDDPMVHTQDVSDVAPFAASFDNRVLEGPRREILYSPSFDSIPPPPPPLPATMSRRKSNRYSKCSKYSSVDYGFISDDDVTSVDALDGLESDSYDVYGHDIVSVLPSSPQQSQSTKGAIRLFRDRYPTSPTSVMIPSSISQERASRVKHAKFQYGNGKRGDRSYDDDDFFISPSAGSLDTDDASSMAVKSHQ